MWVYELTYNICGNLILMFIKIEYFSIFFVFISRKKSWICTEVDCAVFPVKCDAIGKIIVCTNPSFWADAYRAKTSATTNIFAWLKFSGHKGYT